jgi:hypothetical protein
MPLSSPAPRKLRHTRAITVEAYARDDGLWDLDACIRDIKTHDIELAFRPSSRRLPVHDLKLRVTIDRDMVVTSTPKLRPMPFPIPVIATPSLPPTRS